MPPHPHCHWRDSQAWKQLGLEMSTTSDEACKMYDAILTQVVNHFDDGALGGMAKCLERMTEADPNFVLGLAMKHSFNLQLIHHNYTHAQEVYHMMELSQQPHVKPWERKHAEATKLLSEGKFNDACSLWEDILLDHPKDLLSLKMLHEIYIINGNSCGLRDSIARVAPYWTPDMPHYGDMLAMYGFGLEETNMYDVARQKAQQALEINPYNAWATHCLAHVNEMTGNHKDGLAFMAETEANWNYTSLKSHNYWHWALYYHEMGDFESAAGLLDNQILPTMKETKSWFALTDAASLCFRLEAEDYDIGNRWPQFAEIAKDNKYNHVMPYADFNVALASLRGGDWESAQGMLEGLKKVVKNNEGDIARAYNEVTIPVIEATMAYEKGDFDRAVDILKPLKYQMYRMGGSHAQRDIFNNLTIHAGLRSKRPENQNFASQLLHTRKQLKVNSPLADRLLLGLATA
ncbi:tetratricopeptide repeat protein 38-like [Dreissena polymorpha]|uniref:tetratricopeptide repeat protein 38-like n=1 Tax=Dreissena polymorpha TaxID=45954 RepID=UPI002264881C|nr:tetratricopeptide repeat protein 38-like [Dreissena polymorpha]